MTLKYAEKPLRDEFEWNALGRPVTFWSEPNDPPTISRGRCYCGSPLSLVRDISTFTDRVTVNHGELPVFCTDRNLSANHFEWLVRHDVQLKLLDEALAALH